MMKLLTTLGALTAQSAMRNAMGFVHTAIAKLEKVEALAATEIAYAEAQIKRAEERVAGSHAYKAIHRQTAAEAGKMKAKLREFLA